MSHAATRRAVVEDRSLVGADLCRAHSDAADVWLASLLDAATDDGGGVALVAVGGYGRAELSPQSDIDVVLLHDGRRDIATLADRLWYPIWDEGVKLGHAVRTIREALVLASDDLDTATSLLELRHVAGDARLTAELHDRALLQWRKRAKRWLAELGGRVRERHGRAGEVAFLLEPDLKEGRGGLRDVHALRWAEAARALLWDGDRPTLDAAYATLLDARVELHRSTARPGDRLVLEEQDAVATALGHRDADVLMHDVAAAARMIAWRSDDTWQRIGASLRGPAGRLVRRDRSLGAGIVLREDEVHLSSDADPGTDATLALRAAAAAARHRTVIHRASLDRLASTGALGDPWPDAAREALVELLLAGPAAVPVIEALDQVGAWAVVLPEWAPVRSRPQRNAYHRFTVDRHLIEAAANAAGLAPRVARPDLLVVGALLHDLGKGYPGDHTDAGVDLVAAIGPRLGFAADDVAILQDLVRHHLLLPDVATRRDLADPETIEAVALVVGDADRLHLLAALTEADSLATGPAAWGSWKADLVADLVRRVAHVLEGGGPADAGQVDFPTPAQRALLEARAPHIEGSGNELTVVWPDRGALFSRVAGVLALHGLDVLDAAVTSDAGWALETFRVESSFGPTFAWGKVVVDLERALEGRLALDARLAERARVYGTRRRTTARPADPTVRVDNGASATCSVVEIHAPDSVGLLHRITRVLADLHLDVVSAKVHTVGTDVVDAFYVRDERGGRIEDPGRLSELERALLHAVDG